MKKINFNIQLLTILFIALIAITKSQVNLEKNNLKNKNKINLNKNKTFNKRKLDFTDGYFDDLKFYFDFNNFDLKFPEEWTNGNKNLIKNAIKLQGF